jgi:hypothetical protein
MTSLQESWKRTRSRLLRAHERASTPTLDAFREYLDHNELELAADVLADFGDEQGDMPCAFQEALTHAYENMELEGKATLCRLRVYEAEHGFVEAQLTLTPTEAGGRSHPVLTGYRPDWDIGNRTDSSELEINGAPVTLEDARSIPPGGSGRVRLHPLWRDAWTRLKVGTEIAMHEGARVVGRAVVLRVTLRESRR